MLPSFTLSPTWNNVVLVPPWVSSIPYKELYIPPSKLIWFSKEVPVLTKSGIPSPAPSFSAISWKSLSTIVLKGVVKVTILVPAAST